MMSKGQMLLIEITFPKEEKEEEDDNMSKETRIVAEQMIKRYEHLKTELLM